MIGGYLMPDDMAEADRPRTPTLTYPGDVTGMVGEVVGPSTDGRLFVAAAAARTDDGRTRVAFRPLTAQELTSQAAAGNVKAIA